MSCGRSSTPIWTSFMAPLRAWDINKASGARQEQLGDQPNGVYTQSNAVPR